MSDPAGPQTPPAAPITVNASFTSKGLWKLASMGALFALGATMDRHFSGATVAAGLAFIGAVGLAGAELWRSWKTHTKFRFLASIVPDEIAQVKR